MRGLKHHLRVALKNDDKSHLLQMRGLKPMPVYDSLLPKVASFTDAWIETGLSITPSDIERVASFTDAWIET